MRSDFAVGHVAAVKGQTAEVQFFFTSFFKKITNCWCEADSKQNDGFLDTEALYLHIITMKWVLTN